MTPSYLGQLLLLDAVSLAPQIPPAAAWVVGTQALEAETRTSLRPRHFNCPVGVTPPSPGWLSTVLLPCRVVGLG